MVEMLYKLLSVTINTKYRDVIPTEENIREEAAILRKICPVSDQDFEQAIKMIHATMLVSMDIGVVIVDPTAKHQPWFMHRKARENFFFYWTRYERFLADMKNWSPRVVATVNDDSDRIIDLCGDPEKEELWQRRGLVIGDVQSGKTANYTALCCKAADAGYKVIILLTGTLENLRRQTQGRLDAEFIGRKSGELLKRRDRQSIFIGVGRIDNRRNGMVFTSINTDFRASTLNAIGLSLRECREPALFVVKKNRRILENLEQWLRTFNAGADQMLDLPLLLIDDEADNASVNTRQGGGDYTAINGAIRGLLNCFHRATYIGVTATPYANIFIDPDDANEMVGNDLFPRDFIYSISSPTNYIGADAIFGEDAPYAHNLEIISDAEAVFPLRHKTDLQITDLTQSLKDAIVYFVLLNAVADHKGQNNSHRSMLVNVSRFTGIQDQIALGITEFLNWMRTDIRNYSRLSLKEARRIESLRFLESIWDKYNLSAETGAEWSLVLSKYLSSASEPIEVRPINQRTGASSLDYTAYAETGLRVIAVGGNSLSRGLTLEGLRVSYFYRNSRAYDTLMQMGRWFGYRSGFENLFKIWMSQDACDWYAYISMASNELKDEIRRMNRLNQTPKEFGLKVREHPDVLYVTALNKMRNAQLIERWISVNGKLVETPRLYADPDILQANERAVTQFIQDLPSKGVKAPIERCHGSTVWSNIPGRDVAALLRNFTSFPLHFAFHSVSLAEFIEEPKNTHLQNWDIIIPNGSGSKIVIGDTDIRMQIRKVEENNGELMISGTKKRVGSGGCTRAGLSQEQIDESRRIFFEQNPYKKNVSDTAYLIEGRRPVLFLHLIKPVDSNGGSIVGLATLTALGLGFPRVNGDQGIKALYRINLVEAQNLFPLEEEDDDVDERIE